MAKHEDLPFMKKADIITLGRLEPAEPFKHAKVKEEDNSNDSLATSSLLETKLSKKIMLNPSIFTDDDDDDIIEISPPKRKSPTLDGATVKRSKMFYLNKSM